MVADQALSEEEVIRYRDRILDYRHTIINSPAPHSDPDQNGYQRTIQDEYRAFLISVSRQAGFVPESPEPGLNRNKNHTLSPPEEQLLSEIVEEYIVERAYQAESAGPDEEDTIYPERSIPFCRDSHDTAGEKNRAKEENSITGPHTGYPAITSPDNRAPDPACQEQA